MSIFHLNRRNGIGASDGPAILGLNPYKTPLEVWSEKTGLTTDDFTLNSAIHHGNIAEPGMIADLYSALSPHGYSKIDLPTNADDSMQPKKRVHPDYDFIYFHPDAIFKKDDIEVVVEIKTGRKPTPWNLKAGSDRLNFDYKVFEELKYATIEDVPPHYYWQVQHQLMVNGSEEGILYAEIGGYYAYRIFKIKRDVGINKYRRQLIRFWRHHVEKKIEPAPVNEDDVKRLLAWGKKEEGEIILADKNITRQMHRYKKITALESRLKTRKEAAKDEIALALREGTELRGTDIAASYTKSNRSGKIIHSLKIKEIKNEQHAA